MMAPSEFSLCVLLFTALLGFFLCGIGAWIQGLFFVCGAAYIAYVVNNNP
jgi:hypothetical protein